MDITNVELTKNKTIKIVKNNDNYSHFFEYDDYSLLEHIKVKEPYSCKTINHYNQEVEYIDIETNKKIILQVKPKRVYTELDIMKIIRARKARLKRESKQVNKCSICKLKQCNKECFNETIKGE